MAIGGVVISGGSGLVRRAARGDIPSVGDCRKVARKNSGEAFHCLFHQKLGLVEMQ